MPLLFTVIDRVFSPFDHCHPAPLEAVSVTVDGAQNVVGPPTVMVAGGLSSTVTVLGALVALQPSVPVTVT